MTQRQYDALVPGTLVVIGGAHPWAGKTGTVLGHESLTGLESLGPCVKVRLRPDGQYSQSSEDEAIPGAAPECFVTKPEEIRLVRMYAPHRPEGNNGNNG